MPTLANAFAPGLAVNYLLGVDKRISATLGDIFDMKLGAFSAGIAVGLALSAAATSAALNIVGGVIGVLPGYGNTSAICVDTAGNIRDGVTIKTIPIPMGDSVSVGNGVTFRCP